MPPKKRLELRIEPELRDGLDVETARTGTPLTTLVERYIRDGLARDHGQLIETDSLPEIRAAVREETARAIGAAYQQLETGLDRMTHRNDERLVKLIVNAARYAGHGQHMVHSLIAKQYGRDLADRILEAAREVVGKEIARRDKTTEN